MSEQCYHLFSFVYAKILPARDNEIDQHLSIGHKLFDVRVHLSITAVTRFQLLQLVVRSCS